MTTKPQKIEGGWEEVDKQFENIFQKSDYVDDRGNHWCVDGFVFKDKFHQFISDLLASERQRCVEIIKEVEKRDFPRGEREWCGICGVRFSKKVLEQLDYRVDNQKVNYTTVIHGRTQDYKNLESVPILDQEKGEL